MVDDYTIENYGDINKLKKIIQDELLLLINEINNRITYDKQPLLYHDILTEIDIAIQQESRFRLAEKIKRMEQFNKLQLNLNKKKLLKKQQEEQQAQAQRKIKRQEYEQEYEHEYEYEPRQTKRIRIGGDVKSNKSRKIKSKFNNKNKINNLNKSNKSKKDIKTKLNKTTKMLKTLKI
jgi:hypothetical protein